jgi:phosphate transport system substrate-binding protein
MTKLLKTITGFLLLTLLFLFACQNKKEDKETIIKGKASLLVDESIFPIVEDEQTVFETQYDAKLKLISKSENEIINQLLNNDTIRIAVLPRKLSEDELKAFSTKKIIPKTTHFATDAVVFIRNKSSKDTLIALEDVINFMKGNAANGIKGLVFDNPNSSTVRYISDISGVKVSPQKNIYSFKTNNEVIKYVAENDGMIGVVGINWLFQPPLDMQKTVEQTTILSVKNNNEKEYIYPSQDNLAQGKYPLARDLYIINCQGYSGLGMGFASFLGGERGQRIVLKSGLVPVRYPSRKIVTRNKISNDKN